MLNWFLTVVQKHISGGKVLEKLDNHKEEKKKNFELNLILCKHTQKLTQNGPQT